MNKVATAVELRFEAQRSPHLSESLKQRLQRIAGRRWTKDGAIVLQVGEARSQARNREIARARLKDLILRATIVPKRRKPTQVSEAQKRRRLAAKKHRSALKTLRATPDDAV